LTREFKGVWIPKEIWLTKKLTLQEKVFLVEIDSLNNENGCYASNDYFSEFFGLSKNRCSEIINSLAAKQFITISYIWGAKKNIEKRILKIKEKETDPIRKIEQGYSENRLGVIEKSKDNNIIISNTIINNKHLHILSEYVFTHDIKSYITIYLKVRAYYRNKEHKKINNINISYIESVINSLIEKEISLKKFEDAAYEYFEKLKKSNDGDIVCFLKASQKRLFDLNWDEII
jgi:hypothetical protein